APPGRQLGNILLALQGAFWGIYTVASKPLTGRHSALAVSLWSTALGCLALGLLAPLEWATLRPGSLDGTARLLGLQEGVPAGAATRPSRPIRNEARAAKPSARRTP